MPYSVLVALGSNSATERYRFDERSMRCEM